MTVLSTLHYRLRYWWHIRRHRLKVWFIVRPAVWWRGVPVIAVAGSNGKTTTAHLIDRMLRAAGYRVGLCTTHGVYHDGRQVAHGDRAGHHGVLRALRCPGLQVIVAETGRGGILRFGLGYGTCRVGVVTNVLPDHLGSEGITTVEQMAGVKATIPRHTDPRGTVVLNADDPRVAAMAGVTRAMVSHFTIAGRENEFARGWFLRDGQLWRKADGWEEVLLPVTEVPLTLGGLQRHHIANTLAALAAVDGIRDRLPVPDTALREALRHYALDPRDYPDRFTLTRYRGHYVLLAYCKNPNSYRVEIPLVRRLQAALGCHHLVAVVTAPGDRLMEWYADISQQLAAVCDGLFVFPPPPQYRRGMTDAEMARRLAGAMPGERVLGTTFLLPEDVLAQIKARWGDSFLLWYSVASGGHQLDVDAFLREAEIVPFTSVLLREMGLASPSPTVIFPLVITDGTVLKSSPEMKYQSLGTGQPTVIVSLMSGYLYTANQTTQSFLEAIDGQKTFGAIVVELTGQYDVSADKLAADMRALAEKLVGEKLLTIVAEATAHA
jgi:hypothetical protein